MLTTRNKILPLSSSILIALSLSSCGGGASDDFLANDPTDPEVIDVVEPIEVIEIIDALSDEENAIALIKSYANNETNSSPSINDYLDAGVDGIDGYSATELNELNDTIKASTPEEVDTSAELNAIVAALNIPSDDSCLSEIQQELLDAHNAARAEARSCGGDYYEAAPALTWSCQLGEAATSHSNYMANTGELSHTGAGGSSAGDRISDTGYSFRTWGENIAVGQKSVESVMLGWLGSDGHCRGIMNSNYTEMGAAQVETNTNSYTPFWTAVFATPRS